MTGTAKRDFWMLSCGQLLVLSGFFSFFQFPLYIKDLGGGEQAVGIIMAMGTLASGLFLPWITATADRIERRTLMLAGICVQMAATIAMVLTAAPGVIMALLIVIRGVGFGLYLIASGSYLAQIMPEAEKGRWVGINFGFNQLAVGLGPFIGELAISLVGFPFFFFVSSAFMYSGMMMVLGLNTRHPVPPEDSFHWLRSVMDFYRNLFKGPFLRSFITLLFIAGALGGVFNYMALYALLLGLGSGIFFITYSIANAGIRFGGSGLADRYGRAKVVSPMLVLLAVGIFLLVLVESNTVLVISALLIGVGFGLSNPAILAGMLDRASPRMQPMAVASFHFAFSVGLSVTPPVFGTIVENYGYFPMWWIAGSLCLVAIPIYLVPARWPRFRLALPRLPRLSIPRWPARGKKGASATPPEPGPQRRAKDRIRQELDAQQPGQ